MSSTRPTGKLEWIGGRVSPPFFIDNRDTAARVEMVLWFELPTGLVVGQETYVDERGDGAVARALRAALDRPLAGPPRRPDKIRVGDQAAAVEVRSVLGPSFPVVVAATPELEDLVDSMVEHAPTSSGKDSYLANGRVSPKIVQELFETTRTLFHLEPWSFTADSQVLRMDIPALGIDGACLSIIGALGQERGVIVFPSLADYERLVRGAAVRGRRRDIDLGGGWLALNFEHGSKLPKSMRREVEAHGWPVVGPDAYPRVERRDRDGATRPLVERDLTIVSACVSALSAFCVKHSGLLAGEAFEPVCESYLDNHDLEVRFTLPYEAFSQFEIVERPDANQSPSSRRARPSAGRNDPCPCGSGRKYKKCHLPTDTRPVRGDDETHHDFDRRLLQMLEDFAEARFGSAWRKFGRDFTHPQEVRQLSAAWSIYHFQIGGTTVADTFLEERGATLTPPERAWVLAQRAAWLSVWKVTAAEPGVSLTLRDLLTQETRRVLEKSGSRTTVIGDAMLARVVDHGDGPLVCGAHPSLLTPIDAAEVVRLARGRLRSKSAIAPARLREESFGRYLIRRWEDAVARREKSSSTPPVLQNTDGDPLLLTIDHFRISPEASTNVAARLVEIDGIERDVGGAGTQTYAVFRPGDVPTPRGDRTIVGCLRVLGDRLTAETNSIQRADALRVRIEAACGDQVQHRAREHTDPLSPHLRGAPAGPEPEFPPPEVEQALREFKERHYAKWIDEPIPALGGTTPRNTARTAKGREAVALLLDDMENRERRLEGPTAYDFSRLRRELRLD